MPKSYKNQGNDKSPRKPQLFNFNYYMIFYALLLIESQSCSFFDDETYFLTKMLVFKLGHILLRKQLFRLLLELCA